MGVKPASILPGGGKRHDNDLKKPAWRSNQEPASTSKGFFPLPCGKE